MKGRGPCWYELFCGGGMARAGLGSGWDCLFANDIDPKNATSYAANWGRGRLRVSDVADLTARDLPDTRILHGRLFRARTCSSQAMALD